MKTIALRFAENFAPQEGTIRAHEQLIEEIGYVWYGKLGAPISNSIKEEILKSDTPRILLIQSGKFKRYWAYVDKMQKDVPPINEIPEYYRYDALKFHYWFKITKFVEAPSDVMNRCTVISSNMPLSESSSRSLSPYFKISYEE